MRSTATKPANGRASHNAGSMLTRSSYLEVTYSASRAPKGSYPHLLGKWLLDSVYGKPGRLLDLGCGRGDHLDVFARLGFDVAGVDVSPAAPELAGNYRVEVADMESDPLPFAPGSFDFVFSKSVVEHMNHPGFVYCRKPWKRSSPAAPR